MSTLLENVQLLVEAEREHRKQRDVASLEARMMAAMSDLWAEQRKQWLKRAARTVRPMLQESQAGNEAVTVFDVVAADTRDPFRDETDPLVRSGVQRGGNSVLLDAEAGISFSVSSPVAQEYLATRSAEMIRGIDNTTREIIRRTIDQGVRDRLTYGQIADQISDRFDDFSTPSPLRHIRNRAELVSVTEMGEAYEVGRSAGAEQLREAGLEMEKAWLTVGDDAVDDTICGPNGNAGWIEWKDVFPSGHERPLGHPGCRCDMQTRVKRER